MAAPFHSPLDFFWGKMPSIKKVLLFWAKVHLILQKVHFIVTKS
jgi:hypothetical protein